MDETNVTDVLPPSFGGRLRTEAYYTKTSNVIRILRGRSSLRIISQHLNSQGFTTPTGLPFTRDRLARYIKSNKI
ncbi:hypothetical protein FG94_02888 [Massilia sp. LC238]|jgi:hypothetical protein|nr:hypothetical protein FG94_02888 [Massilia sp. LC238]